MASNFILKSRTETMSAIHHQRKKVGSVWQPAGSDQWSASMDFKGRKLSLKADSKDMAWIEIVAQANRVALGCEPEDQAGAREALNKRNEAIDAEAREINKAAGRIIVKVSNSRVDV